MTTPALYSLASEYRQLLDKLSDGDFDLQTIHDTIEASGLVDDITTKAVGIEMVARELEAYTPMLEVEIKRMGKLAAQRTQSAKALRDYLKTNMQACGISKIESPLFKIRLQDNPPAVEVYELGLIPAEFMTQPAPPPPAPDKTAIKAALKLGIEVQGCRLTHGVSLRVS